MIKTNGVFSEFLAFGELLVVQRFHSMHLTDIPTHWTFGFYSIKWIERERVNQCHSFACHLVHLCLNCDKRFEECVYILTCSWPTHDRISIKWNNTTSTITTTTTRRGKKETINMRFLWYHHNIKCHTWIRCEGIIWWQRRCTQAIGLDCFVL